MADVMKKQFYRQRSDFDKSCVERDKKFTMPKGVEYTENIAYASDGNPAHMLDIFRPKNTEGKLLPVIINIHGGGLIIGNKGFNKYFCALLSKRGFLVYSVEYRLVPDCTIYDQFRDVFMAMDYIKERIKTDGGNDRQVYMVGDSGGACLIMYTNAIQNNSDIAKAAGVKPSSLHINALGFISGMFYTNRFDKIGLFLPKYLYGKGYKKSEFGKYVNPGNKELIKALAPVWLVTSHNDYLRRYTLDFKKALADNKKEYELVDFPKDKKLVHAFCVFEPFLKESSKTIDELVKFLRRF